MQILHIKGGRFVINGGLKGIFMIKRYSEDYLWQWYSKKNRKPLVIRGARQVGKSTLVREFSKNCGHSLLEINLEKHLNMDRQHHRQYRHCAICTKKNRSCMLLRLVHFWNSP
jgi:hypothetical protein